MINLKTKEFISGWKLDPRQEFYLRKTKNIS